MNAGIFGFATPHCWTSPLVALATGTNNWTLPIDRAPDLMGARVVNQIAELTWKPGDELDGMALIRNDGAGNNWPALACGYSVQGDATMPGGLTLTIDLFGASPYTFLRYGGSGSLSNAVTAANWMVRAYAIWFHP